MSRRHILSPPLPPSIRSLRGGRWGRSTDWWKADCEGWRGSNGGRESQLARQAKEGLDRAAEKAEGVAEGVAERVGEMVEKGKEKVGVK